MYDLFFSLFTIFFLLIFSFLLFFINSDIFYEILIFVIVFYLTIIFFIFNLTNLFNYFNIKNLQKSNKLYNIVISLIFVSLFFLIGCNFYNIIFNKISKNIISKKNNVIVNCVSTNEYCNYTNKIYNLDKNIIFQKFIHILILYIFLIIIFYFYNKKNSEIIDE